ncbi:MAG: PriCT-2 domain-containing protein [Planctomycetota bacterium]|nr:PriCT-2 domain-containing protein [Planctomycetota bacterium]
MTTTDTPESKQQPDFSRPAKPLKMAVNIEAIPEEIRGLPRWVLWNWTWSQGKKKYDKPPRQRDGCYASSTNANTWITFEDAIQHVDYREFDGIGFVLIRDDDIAGIDLDDCRNLETGEIAEPAASIIRDLDTYAEVSPSGTGVKMLVRATLPPRTTKVNHEVGVEIYDSGRYFTITGNILPGSPSTINPRQKEVERVLERFVAKHELPPASPNSRKTTTSDDGATDDVALARSVLAAIPGSIADQYRDWIAVGMALKSVSDELLPDWETWSRQSPKFAEGECRKKWQSFCGKGIRLGSLVHLAKQNGWRQAAGQRKAKAQPDRSAPSVGGSGEYEVGAGGTYWRPSTRDGDSCIRLANFQANITREIIHDDGAEQARFFEIVAERDGQKETFTISAQQFQAMNWPAEQLGARAIVEPGPSRRERLRHAIQVLSGNMSQQTVFGHTGWRQVNGQWVYLQGGGAIGPDGAICDIQVDLPDALNGFALTLPKNREDLRESISASLRFLELADERVTIPLFAGTYRAVLGPTDFTEWLEGRTGSGKSALAALLQQHFGPSMHAENLPANWGSTSNALESVTFAAKDTLLVVDDFAPEGTSAEVAKDNRNATRLLRAKGNRSGRARLRSDTTLRPTKWPRALILATGEDIPPVHSIKARCLILEMGDDLKWATLTGCQKDAAAGKYAAAMAGYIHWVAKQYESILDRHSKRITELREDAHQEGVHRRTPAIIAELQFAMEVFVDFAVDAGAMSPDSGHCFLERSWCALGAISSNQEGHQKGADPVERFLSLLRAAINSGHAHLASSGGAEPENPSMWGWRERKAGIGVQEPVGWHALGDRIGWVQGDDAFLDQDATYRILGLMAANSSEGVAVSARTLAKRLKDRGLLVATEEGRFTVRVMLEGKRQHVLHLRADTLFARGLVQDENVIRQFDRSQPKATDHSADGVSAVEAHCNEWTTCNPGLPQQVNVTGPAHYTGIPGENTLSASLGPVGPESEAQITSEALNVPEGDWGHV